MQRYESRKIMRKLNHQLKKLCQRHSDGSYGTQKDRYYVLQLAANQLLELGFRNMSHRSLKLKHTKALFQLWHDQQVSPKTIKNRLSYLRWWARQAGKPDATFKTNDEYYHSAGFTSVRQPLSTSSNKALHLDAEVLEKVSCHYIRSSLLLQALFGLRREEAIKFRVSYADRGQYLVLKGSWTKGGKARRIPIRNALQIELLENIKSLVGGGSLIPSGKNYRQQLKLYESQTVRAGLNKLHGLRHAYAQTRYQELTGWRCPHAGGPKARELTQEQKMKDLLARQTISKELGHERIYITKVYLGC